MKTPIRAYWCLSNNFGDALSVWLIKKITGELPIYADLHSGYKKFVVTGSILKWCDRDCIVWGAGFSDADDVVKGDTDIKAVRGPLTIQRVKICTLQNPTVFGDPGLLMPKFYQPDRQNKKYELGIIPHYMNQSEVYRSLLASREGVKVINVFDSVESIVEQIVSCCCVLSSSLHGLVVADAYDVPARWMEGSDRLGGDTFKFKDHLMAVGIEPYKPVKFCEVEEWSLEKIVQLIGVYQAKVDTEMLWNVCPFK